MCERQAPSDHAVGSTSHHWLTPHAHAIHTCMSQHTVSAQRYTPLPGGALSRRCNMYSHTQSLVWHMQVVPPTTAKWSCRPQGRQAMPLTPCPTWCSQASPQPVHTLWTDQRSPSLLLCTALGPCTSGASRPARQRQLTQALREWSCLVTWAVRCCPFSMHMQRMCVTCLEQWVCCVHCHDMMHHHVQRSHMLRHTPARPCLMKHSKSCKSCQACMLMLRLLLTMLCMALCGKLPSSTSTASAAKLV